MTDILPLISGIAVVSTIGFASCGWALWRSYRKGLAISAAFGRAAAEIEDAAVAARHQITSEASRLKDAMAAADKPKPRAKKKSPAKKPVAKPRAKGRAK